MKTPNYVFDDELYHHGILGQRWGHRRFQNEDGSWTPEGRERYGEGDKPHQAAKLKVNARAKARAAFAEKKFKLEMKSKEQKLKDKIAAKEERNRVKERAKTERLANREQAKLDRKEAVRRGRELGLTKNMSNDDLQTAISRLKLEAEYNKSYALASNPNGLLARADRFFEGPTGQAVKAVAVATLPKVAEQATSKILESNLKYANKLDRDKQKADIEKTRSEAQEKAANARQVERESKNRVILDREKAEQEKLESNRKFEQEKLESDREFKQQQKRDQDDYDLNKMDKLHTAAVKKAELKLDQEKQNAEQERLNAKQKAEQERLNKKQEQDLDLERKAKIGYRDQQNWWHKGSIQLESEERSRKLDKEKWAIDRVNAIDDDMRDMVKEGKLSPETFAKTVTSTQIGDTIASVSRSQNPTIKDIVSSINKSGFNVSINNESNGRTIITASEESAIRSAAGSAEDIARRFGVSPETVYRIRRR